MTVCMAALCDGGKGCVLISDQMTTAHFPIGYEFESEEVEKIVRIGDSAQIYALISGDVFFANEVIEKAKGQAKEQGINTTNRIADLMRDAYQEVRRQHLVRNELESRGLDITTYYQNHQRMLPPIVQMIDKTFVTWDPRVEFIVAGVDESLCRVFTIMNPGDSSCHDPLGYAAIGSGAPHAIYSMIDSNYKRSLSKDAVLELLEKAKQRSEVAPGVGKDTKTIIIQAQ